MRKWTINEKEAQSKLIRQQKPWLYSTGPKTAEGKAISKNNSFKHGARCKEIKDLQHQMAEWKKELNCIVKSFDNFS